MRESAQVMKKVFGLLPFSEQMKLTTPRGKRRGEKLFVTFNEAFHVRIAFGARRPGASTSLMHWARGRVPGQNTHTDMSASIN